MTTQAIAIPTYNKKWICNNIKKVDNHNDNWYMAEANNDKYTKLLSKNAAIYLILIHINVINI